MLNRLGNTPPKGASNLMFDCYPTFRLMAKEFTYFWLRGYEIAETSK
jgi:hypothetical protein